MPDPSELQYETHFYCALCGGPFSDVYRTPEQPAKGPYNEGLNGYGGDPADTDRSNEFNFGGEENLVIPDEVVENDMGYSAKRNRKLRIRAQKDGLRKGIMSGNRTVRQSYDGRRISVSQMEWTKTLRALIHTNATYHPQHHHNYLQGGQNVYLTGRGLIRHNENMADAYASHDENELSPDYESADDDDDDEARHTKFPWFPESDRIKNTFGFQLYQDLESHSTCVISSIPFHDECWSLLDLALEASGHERGLMRMNEKVSPDQMWDYLRSLIVVSGKKEQSVQTRSILQPENRKCLITRLEEVDYREAQSGGEGWHWKHEDGCHWLVADPSSISVRDAPLKCLPNTDLLPLAPRAALIDSFMLLPPEVILMVASYLTSSDIFCWKMASPSVMNVGLPEIMYRRFLREEFKYLPKLGLEIQEQELNIQKGRGCSIDWRGSFDRLRRLIRTPRLSNIPTDDDYGKEWDEVDIGLKNRARIWKIVKPIAETLVETSSMALQGLHGAHKSHADRTSIFCGQVGVRSGKEGAAHTVYLGPRANPGFENAIQVRIQKIRIWTDDATRMFCGLRFEILDEVLGPSTKPFGRSSSEYVDLNMVGVAVSGFAFCVSNGVVSGVQVFYLPEGDLRQKGTLWSKRIGIWDGPMRKVTIPCDSHKFIGVTGFLNSNGFLETVGILEENLAVDGFGASNASSLSHDVASLWKNKLPPTSVELREREGVDINDWRLCGSEWEVWAPQIIEDGVTFRRPLTPRVLKTIIGYYDDQFLRGLEFVYVGLNQNFSSIIGVKEGTKQGSISFERGESVAASVISFGKDGVHGILFVTDRGKISEVFGPRYLGTHKVFAPPPDDNDPWQRGLRIRAQSPVVDRSRRRRELREETRYGILGVHALYDYEENRFLQLGLILPGRSIVDMSIFNHPLPCPIPFDETDGQFAVWSHGPPPDEWIIGKSTTFCQSRAPFRDSKSYPLSDYSGWVKLDSMSEVKIYGEMRGIKFTYGDNQKELYFGLVNDQSAVYVQKFDYDGGERVIGVAVLANGNESMEPSDSTDSGSTISSTSIRGDHEVMERIVFITTVNQHKIHVPIKSRLHSQLEEHLVGIKVCFNCDQLVSWAPFFVAKTSGPKILSKAELIKHINFPWKARIDKPGIQEDRKIPATSYVICAYFEVNSFGRIDAVKGYVTRLGCFCGLLFRRGGKWERVPFGWSSGYEVIFELDENEYFDSLYLPSHMGALGSNALALSTNLGRTTPWFGKVEKGVELHHWEAPVGSVGIGIFAAQIEESSMTAEPSWDILGLLCRSKSTVGDRYSSRPVSSIPRHVSYHVLDPPTGLPWLNDVYNRNAKVRLTPLLMPWNGPSIEPYKQCTPHDLGRAFCIFDPAKLLQIRVWYTRGAICSIRFRGTPEMGTITLGDWPCAEDSPLNSDKKMNISGPDGERIIGMKAIFQNLENKDCVVGLSIETSYGQLKSIVSSETIPEKLVDPNNIKIGAWRCRKNHEIVGLHGVFGLHSIHDIGLVLKRNPRPMYNSLQGVTDI